jgi:hypothetical protein
MIAIAPTTVAHNETIARALDLADLIPWRFMTPPGC